jgi:hypothetical protein
LLTKSGGSLGAARPSSRQILLVADFIRQQTKEDRAAIVTFRAYRAFRA